MEKMAHDCRRRGGYECGGKLWKKTCKLLEDNFSKALDRGGRGEGSNTQEHFVI